MRISSATSRGAPAVPVRLPFGLLDHLLQHELAVADGPVGYPVVLVQVLRAVRRMRQRNPGGHGRVEVGDGEAGAHSQHEVGLPEEVVDHQGRRVGPRTERQRMVLRVSALAGQRGHDRYAGQLGELHQLVGSFGVEYSLAGVDHRIGGGQQRLDEVADVVGVGGGLALRDGAVVERVARKFGRGDVLGHFQEHRPPAPVPEVGERAGQHFGNPLDHIDVRGPLGDALVVASRAERRRHSLTSGRLAAGEQQEGDRVGESLGDAAERVLRAGAPLHGEDTDPLAVGYPAEAVGHVDAGALLPADDGPDALLSARLDKRLVRIAGHPLDALGSQYLRDDRVAVHMYAPCWRAALDLKSNARAGGAFDESPGGSFGVIGGPCGAFADILAEPRKAARYCSTSALPAGFRRRPEAA